MRIPSGLSFSSYKIDIYTLEMTDKVHCDIDFFPISFHFVQFAWGIELNEINILCSLLGMTH